MAMAMAAKANESSRDMLYAAFKPFIAVGRLARMTADIIDNDTYSLQ